ncbi:PspC domain-containing protein [Gracilibacillus caseinilyticus]|uniref:PspC domain-containing protein n=1 Tax=Gracilibacillus caseinilyticus TaxID=2932256 RepID=A0ABY4F037_9BACI|nr:PspC domain-containing protein [Gracilibacillus caseinilyticus]UOQ49873.1 PspC domain-containing protein [Gracilibacillus caseinilyticus]
MKLKRSATDTSLHGVCGGIAALTGIYSFAIRLLFVVTFPGSFWIYIILANTLECELPALKP